MKLLLCIVGMIFSSSFNHDIQIAFFKISQNSDKLIIDVTFEKEDIENVLQSSLNNLTSKQLASYLSAHFNLYINGKLEVCEFENMHIEAKHIRMQGSISDIPTEINSIEIINTCLLSIEGHSNIIEIKLNEQVRDFLMNKDRIAINISL